MDVTIKFNQDADVVIQDVADSMPYCAKYCKDEIEYVEVLDTNRTTLHVQFEDGSVGWIQTRHVDFLEC